MPKLFCEYLLENKLIKAEQLLDAFMEQLNHTLSTAEVIYNSNILNKEEILKILIHQQQEGLDFRSSAKNLGLWTYNLSQEVNKKIQATNKPLGEVLIQKGYFNLDSLSSAFASYTENINSLKKTPEKDVKIPETHNPTLSYEYLTCFNNDILPNIHRSIYILKEKDISAENIKIETRKVLAEFVAVRAAANFLGANISQKVANEVVKYFQKSLDSNDSIELQKVIDILELSIEVLIILCNCLQQSNSENMISEEHLASFEKFKKLFNMKD
ncbi:hypothetical protein [Fluviispira sanaruensis]|uniref:Uncharacterized protein n=1 Tax=Fluviispira sanaruensis TaxID=2493639 RepID=A0A4P2VPS5_FLUSA|nr:hypothetical protein [Fluviispira sanaruensis]BBH53849.1 hypothetical protein JCM31447_23020 [Fluviispira sanaruensis]